MGRSRRRARTASATASASGPAPAGTDLRRTLARYLAGAIVTAVLVLLGTVTLAGTLAPWLVLITAAAAAYGLYRWAHGRLADAALSDEDRMLQTMAGGLLVLALGFAAVAAVVLTVT
jgi:hypothetical protein